MQSACALQTRHITDKARWASLVFKSKCFENCESELYFWFNATCRKKKYLHKIVKSKLNCPGFYDLALSV